MTKLSESRDRAKSTWDSIENNSEPIIFLGAATCGLAAGADTLVEKLEAGGVKARIEKVGCLGTCFAEPLVYVKLPGDPIVVYSSVTEETLENIVADHVAGGKVRGDLAMGVLADEAFDGIEPFFKLPALKPQVRIAIRNCGIIDPTNLDHALARGGYEGFERALSMKPEEVIEEVKASGLRGRGGGGFPTGLKWGFARKSSGDEKYLICNADEGDPGAFMDRSLIEGDPHAVLEGMLIAAYAIGCAHGYVYIRAEYPLAISRLVNAMEQMVELGLLGDKILGSDLSFELKIKEGAGAFVCGEETALMASIEGKRGMPRPRPPFPAHKGLWGKPTNINNVETFANVGSILREGADWYAGYGTEKSKGTKTFALAGKIERPGLIEVPMGIILKDVIYEVGGGAPDGATVKAAQTGGPSGGCIPAKFFDSPIDYERLAELGSIMGSGGLVILDETSCMVDLARYFLAFTQSESCGKCVPCRIGTKQMLNTLENICCGRGKESDIELLVELGNSIKKGSLCGLGQTAPNPVLTTIEFFRDEYEAHVKDNRCPAKVCGGMYSFEILEDLCNGCGVCRKVCPSDAIEGKKKVPHKIIQEKCIKCGACFDKCKFESIIKI
ncbi:MAG: NADH-quinone oxidoreductase subunit NuoF [Planctomycetota bacterium]|nr:MAG: NADH-quinone oxidoreductase subunit NuoF [Planctomycetota bacterium]